MRGACGAGCGVCVCKAQWGAHSLCLIPPPHAGSFLSLALQALSSQLGGQKLSAEQVSGALLGQRCWVKWPYLQEAVVEAVSDAGAPPGSAAGRGTVRMAELGGQEACRNRPNRTLVPF